MLKALRFTSLIVLLICELFVLSSCKKQVSSENLKKSLSRQNQIEEDSAGERTKVFSPVSDDKAKQFVRKLDIIISSNDQIQGQVSGPQTTIKKSVGLDVQEIILQKPEIKDFNREHLDAEAKGSEEVVVYKNKVEDIQLVRQKEAKLSDIPVPISSEPLIEYFKFKAAKNEMVLGYNSFMDASSVAKFYNQEMEFFGWENVLFFDGLEKMLIFKKPSRVCSISIRDLKCRARSKNSSRNYKCEIIIFVKN